MDAKLCHINQITYNNNGGWSAHQGSGGISIKAEGAKNQWRESGCHLDKSNNIRIGTVNVGMLSR